MHIRSDIIIMHIDITMLLIYNIGKWNMISLIYNDRLWLV